VPVLDNIDTKYEQHHSVYVKFKSVE